MLNSSLTVLIVIIIRLITLGVDGVEGGHFVVISIAADLSVPDSSNAFWHSVSDSDIVSALSTLMLCWCYVAYDVVDNGVNRQVLFRGVKFNQLPQNSFVKFPTYFAEGIIGMTPQNAENFAKIWRLVSEKFFEIEIILFWGPLNRGSGC